MIHLKNNLYTIAQLLDSPYVAFFNIVNKNNNLNEAIDLSNFEPFGVCMALNDFFKKCSVGKLKKAHPNLNISIPEIFISKDFHDDQIFNLVRIDPIIGDRGQLDNEIIQYNINKNDPHILNEYEITGYNTGYEFVRRLILSYENNRWIDPLKEKWLLGVDNYPLKTIEEMWTYGVPKYGADKYDAEQENEKTEHFNYLAQMYRDPFFPNVLVDELKSYISIVVQFIEEGNKTKEEIQEKLDEMTVAINELQSKFYENDSEIETVARESIGETIEEILKFFKIDITGEDAIRMRDW